MVLFLFCLSVYLSLTFVIGYIWVNVQAALMAQVGTHRNLVSIVGVVTSGNPLVLVVAFCEFGSLLSVLFNAAAESTPVPLDLKLGIAFDIASGMDFLHACSYIHRDLAARNVLIATGFIGKIADFGLARSLEFDDYCQFCHLFLLRHFVRAALRARALPPPTSPLPRVRMLSPDMHGVANPS